LFTVAPSASLEAAPGRPISDRARERQNAMALNEYRKKRRFSVTPEPSGKASATGKPKAPALKFVIQKHRASHLHYDFRLEWKGVLLSWAVPKGPSLDPAVKRLAMQVEDHPIEYAGFEGVIPEGEYGGGAVMVWDEGTWECEQPSVDAALAKGDLKFTLHGKKLTGSWALVRTHGYGGHGGYRSYSGGGAKPSWLLIKHRDEYASADDIAALKPFSAVSGRLLADIARENGGNVEKAATGDPTATDLPAKATAKRSNRTKSKPRPRARRSRK